MAVVSSSCCLYQLAINTAINSSSYGSALDLPRTVPQPPAPKYPTAYRNLAGHLVTSADVLLCLQLHTVRSPHTVHASNQCWCLAVPTAAHSSLSIFLAIFKLLCNSPSYNLPPNFTPHPSLVPPSCHLLQRHLALDSSRVFECVSALEISGCIAALLVQLAGVSQSVSPA